jgi:hypothetical protein
MHSLLSGHRQRCGALARGAQQSEQRLKVVAFRRWPPRMGEISRSIGLRVRAVIGRARSRVGEDCYPAVDQQLQALLRMVSAQ